MSSELQQVASPGAGVNLQLENVMPDWTAITWRGLLVGVFWCAFFLLLCYLPVSNPATWHSINVAETIAAGEGQSRLPLSSGMRSIGIGLLGHQCIRTLYLVWGPGGLGLSFAVLQLLTLFAWTLCFYGILKRSLASSAPLLASAIGASVAVASFFQMDGLQGAIFGQLSGSFCILLLLRCQNRAGEFLWHRLGSGYWFGVFVLMVAWTNLDVSFVLGIGILFCFWASRIFEIRQSVGWGLRRAIGDKELRSRTWLLEFAVLATLFTPEGFGLWRAIFWWPDNPIVVGMIDKPIVLASWSGLVFAGGWCVWMYYALKAKRFDPFYLLLAIGFSVLFAFSRANVFWFVAAMGLLICSLKTSVLGITTGNSKQTKIEFESNGPGQLQSFKFAYTLLMGLAVWMTFCFSPWSALVLGGKPREIKQIVGDSLPVEANHFLSQQDGALLHCPVYWCEWIQAGTAIPLMVDSTFGDVPRTVQVDYQKIFHGDSVWQKIAEKYPVNVLLIDKQNQRQLIRNLRRNSGAWRKVYEDSLCLIYRREM